MHTTNSIHCYHQQKRQQSVTGCACLCNHITPLKTTDLHHVPAGRPARGKQTWAWRRRDQAKRVSGAAPLQIPQDVRAHRERGVHIHVRTICKGGPCKHLPQQRRRRVISALRGSLSHPQRRRSSTRTAAEVNRSHAAPTSFFAAKTSLDRHVSSWLQDSQQLQLLLCVTDAAATTSGLPPGVGVGVGLALAAMAASLHADGGSVKGACGARSVLCVVGCWYTCVGRMRERWRAGDTRARAPKRRRVAHGGRPPLAARIAALGYGVRAWSWRWGFTMG